MYDKRIIPNIPKLGIHDAIVSNYQIMAHNLKKLIKVFHKTKGICVLKNV